VKVRYVSLGNEEIQSNGNMSKLEPKGLIETMKILIMEVKSFKIDNERIIISQQQKKNINTHLLKSVNQLQKNVRVGTSSRHEERGRSNDRGENYK
jgi:FtsZ-binding cell division protein ZapB